MRAVLIAAFALMGCATAPSANEARSYAERCEFISFATTEGGFNDPRDWEPGSLSSKIDSDIAWREPKRSDQRCVGEAVRGIAYLGLGLYGFTPDGRYAAATIHFGGRRTIIASVTCYFERAGESWREVSCNTTYEF